jgi:monoamine oxidase
MSHPNLEVVIVGAGFSGLAAARKLHQNQVSFILLEARDRLGGRVYTKRFEDFYLDFGGQWIGPTQDRMYALCKEFGVEFFETYNSGKNIIDLRKKIKTYRGVIPKLNIFALLNLDWLMRKMQKMANSISLEAPWTHAKAKEWDQVTLEDFLRKNTRSKDAYTVIRVGCETIFACEPKDLSLLHALFYIRSGTSLDCLITIDGGAQQHRIKGGMQHLAEQMAAPFSSQIRFDSPVQEIQKTENGYQVSGTNFEIYCEQVIMAIPPPLLAKIKFEPSLSEEKSELLKNYPMGKVGKCFLIFEKPFWRELGFSGQSVADENVSFQTLFDCSPADGSKGILMGFTIGSRAERFFELDRVERQNTMVKTVSRYFGPQAENFNQYEDFSMSDEPWSGGCYAALMQTGAWTQGRDAYRKSEGNIHFAGTEAAERWHGYIEGAVRAGELAADKIINSKS